MTSNIRPLLTVEKDEDIDGSCYGHVEEQFLRDHTHCDAHEATVKPFVPESTGQNTLYSTPQELPPV